MELYPAYAGRHPIALVDSMPSRADSVALFVSALRVSLAAVLFYFCAQDWSAAQAWSGLPLMQALRDDSAEITGIAAAWLAFEFLVFAARARRAAAPRPL